jgi:hypothetical protein
MFRFSSIRASARKDTKHSRGEKEKEPSATPASPAPAAPPVLPSLSLATIKPTATGGKAQGEPQGNVQRTR